MNDPRTLAESMLLLRNCVEQLTQEHAVRTRITQDGKTVQAVIMHRPLIHQLRQSIYTSTSAGNGAAGVTEARARSVVNAAALKNLADLREQIGFAWQIIAPGMIRLPALWTEEDALAKWLDVYLPLVSNGYGAVEDVDRFATVFAGWRHTIQQQFVPRQVITSGRPCPACRSVWAVVDGLQVRAIQVSVAATPDRHTAVCRACDKVWNGQEEVAALAADQRDLEADERDLNLLRSSPSGVEPPRDTPEEGTLDTGLVDASH